MGRARARCWRRRSAAWPTAARSLTCLAGDGAPLGEGELRGLLPDGLELDYHRAISRPGGTCWPPSSVRLTHYQARIPTRFADTTELTLDDALRAELRSLPRPSRLGEPLDLREQAREAAAALGIETVGELLEHLPRRHTDRQERRPIAGVGVEEDATVDVLVKSVRVQPLRNRRQRPRTEARVADESGPLVAVWFNQPWVADKLAPGMRRAAPRAHEEGEQVLGGPVRAERRRRGRRCTRSASSRSIPAPRACRRSGCASWPGRSASACTTWWSRCPRTCGSRSGCRTARRPSRRRTSPSRRSDERRRAPPARLRGAVPARARRCPRAAGARREGRPLARARSPPASWSTPGGPRSRSSSTGDQQARVRARSTRTSPRDQPMQRLLMGEVGSRQDGGGAARDAPRGRERRAGRADGAHRDARRAAPRHARPAAGRSACRSRCSPAPRRPPAGASCSSGWPPASCQLLVGTHALIEPAVEFRDLAVVRGRRAAPLRRAPARGARRQGARRAGAARAPHDRHADPAHARADRLRRPRHDAPCASCPPAASRSRRTWWTASAHAPAPTSASARRSRGAAVLRGLPARGGVGDAAGARRPPPRRAAARAPSSATSAWS